MTFTTSDPQQTVCCVNFSALLCSRLCHDLVSPVGALSNGIEILAEEDDPDMRAQVLSLLEDSARQTANRLQFFRLAFGAAGGFGEKVDPREAQKAALSFFSSAKSHLEWRTDGAPIPKNAVKLVLNLVLLAHEALIRGGQVTARIAEQGDGLAISVTGEGDRYIVPDAIAAALAGDLAEDAIDPRTAPSQVQPS